MKNQPIHEPTSTKTIEQDAPTILDLFGPSKPEREVDSSGAAPQLKSLDEMPGSLRPVNRVLTNRNSRPASLKKHRNAILRAQEEMADLGFATTLKRTPIDLFPWHSATTEDLEAFVVATSQRHSGSTAYGRRYWVREILKASHQAGLCTASDLLEAKEALRARDTRAKSGSGRELSRQELDAIFAEVAKFPDFQRLRTTALIGLFAGTGLRLSEVAELRLEDYLRNDQAIYTRKTRTEDSRTAALPELSLKLLDEWVQFRGPHVGALFEKKHGEGEHYSPACCRSLKFPRVGHRNSSPWWWFEFRWLVWW